MQQKMITQKRTQAECRPRYQEVAVDHTAVSDMKYKQMNRAVLTEFLSYSSLKRSKGNTHLFHFLRLWARAATRPGYKDGIAYNTGMLILPLDSKKHRNHLCREQIVQCIVKLPVGIPPEIAQKAGVQRFFVQRGFEINPRLVLSRCQIAQVRGSAQNHGTGQPEVLKHHLP